MGKMKSMSENLVHLMSSNVQYQVFAVGEVLKGAGIPFMIRESSPTTAFTGDSGPLGNQEFLVPPDRLKEAKEVLCANGIVCEVSEHLLHRALDEIVAPILKGTSRDLGRLIHFIEVNNKETVRALLESALAIPGGPELIEDLFFSIDRPEDEVCLRTLARVLGPRAGNSFYDRLKEVMSTGPKDSRIALLSVVPELPAVLERVEALAIGLRDPSVEVREAAGEALFALGRGDHGYEPEAPEDAREEAIRKFLAASK